MPCRVFLYSQPGGTPCRRAKDFLSYCGVDFEERDIRAGYQALYELIEEVHSRQTPTLVVGDRVIAGFHPQEYEAALAANRD